MAFIVPGLFLTQTDVMVPTAMTVSPRRIVNSYLERPRLQLGDADEDVELLLEIEAAAELALGCEARPANVAAWRRDCQAGGAPQRMLGFLHIAKHHREVHDAGEVRLGELDAPAIAKLSAEGVRHQVVSNQ